MACYVWKGGNHCKVTDFVFVVLKPKLNPQILQCVKRVHFFWDPKWHAGLLRGAKRSHNKRKAELVEVTSRKRLGIATMKTGKRHVIFNHKHKHMQWNKQNIAHQGQGQAFR